MGTLIGIGSIVGVGGSASGIGSMAGLAAWYKADSLSLSDSDPVAAWPDVSGNSPAGERNLVQATEAAKPLYKINKINGLPALVFDGVADYLKTAAFTLNQPLHYFLVLNQVTHTNGDRLFDGNVTDSANSEQRVTSGTIRLFAGGVMGEYAGTPIGSYAIYEYVIEDYATITVGAGTTLVSTLDQAGNSNPGGFTLARPGSTASAFGNIEVAEVIIFSRELAGSDLQTVRDYISAKYALDVRPNNLIFSGRDLRTGWSKTRATISDTEFLTHDGLMKAGLEITEDGTPSSTHYALQGAQKTLFSTKYRLSAYVKGGNTDLATRFPCIVFHGDTSIWEGGYTEVSFNLLTEEIIIQTAAPGNQLVDWGWEAAPNGWYYFWIIAQSRASGSGFEYLLGLATDTGDFTALSGNSTSSVLFDDIKQVRVG
jgi:hypothetical protein